jgi:hypothetical protein
MPSPFSHETLDLKISKSSPLLRGILYFLLTIPLILLTAELVARSPLGNLLPAPSVQADSFLFDAKIYALEQQVRRDGGLDCLFIGSSVTNSDVDPVIVEQIYQERTGETIHCYNLGMPAMTIENATALAEVVIARFHPKVIIYPVLSRDISHLVATADFIEKTDWLKTNRGQPSLKGWLVNHSYSYRYFLTWRYWLVTDNRSKMKSEVLWLTPKGFQPAAGIRDPYPANLTLTPKRLSEVWTDPSREPALVEFLALQQKTVRIVLVEGPVYRDPSMYTATDPNWQIYENKYIAPFQQIADENGVSFWRSDTVSAHVPKPQWYDWIHLNSEGAVPFSQWLGEQLAENAWLFK